MQHAAFFSASRNRRLSSYYSKVGLLRTMPNKSPNIHYFGTSVDTQQWAESVTAGVHGVSSKKCRLEDVVE